MRYGSTFQVVEEMEKIMLVVIAMMMIKCSGLEKKKEKNKKLKAKVYLIGVLCFGDQDT
jgi:hypothetical protein